MRSIRAYMAGECQIVEPTRGSEDSTSIVRLNVRPQILDPAKAERQGQRMRRPYRFALPGTILPLFGSYEIDFWVSTVVRGLHHDWNKLASAKLGIPL